MQRSLHRSIWPLFQYLSNHLDFDTMISKALSWICSRLNTNKMLTEGDWIKWHWHSIKVGIVTFFNLKAPKPPRGPVPHFPCNRWRHPSLTFWAISAFVQPQRTVLEELWQCMRSIYPKLHRKAAQRQSITLTGLLTEFQNASLDSTLPSFIPAIYLTHLLHTH